MKGWIDLGSDVNWEDYHGLWGRKARDGSWYVLRFTNLVDAAGKEFEDLPYECDVKRIDLSELTEAQIKRALDSCGLREEAGTLISSSGFSRYAAHRETA